MKEDRGARWGPEGRGGARQVEGWASDRLRLPCNLTLVAAEECQSQGCVND